MTGPVQGSQLGRSVAWVAVTILWAAVAGRSAAQQPQGSPAGATGAGTVTGQVIAQDTQRPARFAQVLLQSVATVSDGENNGPRGGFGSSSSTTTGADGAFTASNVAPGDYYVTATAPGYIAERALLAAQVAAGADPADLLARIPVVHVGVDSISSVTVTMERGGTVAGRVLWDDGSPASGVRISALPNAAAGALPSSLQQVGGGSATTSASGSTDNRGGMQIALIGGGPASASATTDDRGAFRITGLASGDYVVQATIDSRASFGGRRQAGSTTSVIRVYSPGVFRKADAKPIAVRAGDERDDLRMVIDLHGLHTVSGSATSVTAGLSIASGMVSLTDPSDNSLNLNGSVDAHGEFAVQYVPPGNYLLSISGASTAAAPSFRERNSTSASAVSFQSFSEPVSVSDTDLTGLTAALAPTQSSP